MTPAPKAAMAVAAQAFARASAPLAMMFFAGLLLAALHASALAQGGGNLKLLEDGLKAQQNTLEAFKTELTEKAVTPERLSKIEQSLRNVRSDLLQTVAQLREAWQVNKTALDALGPPPEKPSETEPESIAEQREVLSAKQKSLDNLVRGSEVFAAQAFNLINLVTSKRRQRFFEQVFSRQRVPSSSFLWQQAGTSVGVAVNIVNAHVSKWAANKRESQDLKGSLAVIAGALAIAFLIFGGLRGWLGRRIDAYYEGAEATGTSDIAHAGLRALISVSLASFSIQIVLMALVSEGMIAEDLFQLSRRVVVALLILVFAMTLRKNVIRRGVDLTGLPPAQVLANPWGAAAYLIIALTFAIDYVLTEGAAMFNASLYFTFVQSFLAAMVMAAMLLVLAVAGRRLLSTEDGDTERLISRQVRFALVAIAVVTIVAELLGFLAFGRYLVRTGIVLAALTATFALLRGTGRDLLQRLEWRLFQTEEQQQDPAQRPHLLFAYWGALIMDLVLAVLGGLIILRLMRYSWREIRDWVSIAFQGIKIGSATISLGDIATAIVLFLVLVASTRFIQRFFDRELLPQTRLDAGVRNSLVSFIGYAGLIIAGLAAVGAAGVDLSNLAIVAGALSVGIGFGLQSIVNNFVSGLILLFERPVKVGDWIVTDSGEGLVKAIGVRSTIIETFDRSSLIIPNSELIASPVKNWTLGDRVGRAIIPIGVSYDADPHKVHDTLLACLQDSPDVLKDPPPFVLFKDFGASSLDFEARIFLANIGDVFRATNRLRFEIWNRLKAAGIEIPFPQQDLHFKDMDRLEKALSGAKSAGTNPSGAKNRPAATARNRPKQPDATKGHHPDDAGEDGDGDS